MPKRVDVIFGTRPEFIKIAPVVWALEEQGVPHRVFFTGQHKDLVNEALRDALLPESPLIPLTTWGGPGISMVARTVIILQEMWAISPPAIVVVQGDTYSALAGALAAFHCGIPVAHVEAGIRSGVFDNPYSEEANRRCIDAMSTYLFAPTFWEANTLTKGHVKHGQVDIVGNTVVDSLLKIYGSNNWNGRGNMVLATFHRKEFLSPGVARQALEAIYQLAMKRPEFYVVLPVHPNSKDIVGQWHESIKGETKNIYLYPPLPYPVFLDYLSTACLLITDSGGAQEEACCLGIPTIIAREVDDRPVLRHCYPEQMFLAGYNTEAIVSAANRILDADHTPTLSPASTVLGDGTAGSKIVAILREAIHADRLCNNLV